MEFINDYLVPIVTGICLCVGYVLRNLVPSDKVNDFIPLIMAVLGLIINLWVNSFAVSPEIIFGGMASGLAATGTYEASTRVYEKFSQFLKGGK